MDEVTLPEDILEEGAEELDLSWVNEKNFPLPRLARMEIKSLHVLVELVLAYRIADLSAGNAILEGKPFDLAERHRLEEKIKLAQSFGRLPDFLPHDQRREREWQSATFARISELEAAATAFEQAEQRLNMVLNLT